MASEVRCEITAKSVDPAYQLDYPVGQEPASVLTKFDELSTGVGSLLSRLRIAGRDFVGLKTDDPEIYSGQALADFTKDESAWQRVKSIFTTDENDFQSGQKMLIVQTGVVGGLVGFVYGARQATKGIRERFIQFHQTTIWQRPLEATTRLNDTLMFHGFRGGLKYGTKLGGVAMSYAAVVNIVQAARNKSGIIEYSLGGRESIVSLFGESYMYIPRVASLVISGGLWRMNMGLSGMFTAAMLGGFLGTVGGTISYMMLRLSGRTYEEVVYWKKVQQMDRFNKMKEAQRAESKDESDLPLRMHDIFKKANLLKTSTNPNEFEIKLPDKINGKSESS